MRPNKKVFWNILLIVAVTVVAMYFALKDNFSQIVAAIAQMNIFSLIFVLGWGLAINVVIGAGYMVLARHYQKNYSLKQGTVVAFTGTFFAGITPSSTGGQFGQVYVLKKQGFSYSDSVGLLWADFIIYQTVMMIYVTLLFIFRFMHYVNLNAWVWIVAAGYLVNLVVIAALYTLALFPKMYIWLSGKLPIWLSKLHLIKNPEEQVSIWMEQVTGFTEQIRSLSKNKKLVLKTALVNFVRLTMYFSLPYLVAIALGIPLSIDQLIDTMALASFVTMANSFVPLPGASGGTEVFFTMLFSGMLGKLTGAVLLIWRFASYYIPVIGGALVFMIFKNRMTAKEEKEKLSEISADLSSSGDGEAKAESNVRPDSEKADPDLDSKTETPALNTESSSGSEPATPQGDAGKTRNMSSVSLPSALSASDAPCAKIEPGI